MGSWNSSELTHYSLEGVRERGKTGRVDVLALLPVMCHRPQISEVWVCAMSATLPSLIPVR